MEERDARVNSLSFLTGAITVLVVLFLCVTAVSWRIGLDGFAARARTFVFTAFAPERTAIRLPPEILEELTALRSVVGNAGNPTHAAPHDTILVEPDDRFGWVLRPNTRIHGYTMRARNPLNFNQPGVYLEAEARISANLEQYLEAEALFRYLYTIDGDGYRLTLPVVASSYRIPIVGDSVAFGAGVNDEETVASHLQRAIGDRVRVINTGVGSYTGRQALEWARVFAEEGRNRALVYLTSQNDFRRNLEDEKGAAWADNAREILAPFAELKQYFSGNIVVVVVPYLEFTFRDLLQFHGWNRHRIAQSERLYRELPGIAESLGLAYVDWSMIVAEEVAESGSIYSPFRLYVDHAHVSHEASRRIARRVHATLGDPGQAPQGAAVRRCGGTLAGFPVRDESLQASGSDAQG